jgi:hypothetical protein
VQKLSVGIFMFVAAAASAEPVRATGDLRVLPHVDFASAPRIDLLRTGAPSTSSPAAMRPSPSIARHAW